MFKCVLGKPYNFYKKIKRDSQFETEGEMILKNPYGSEMYVYI